MIIASLFFYLFAALCIASGVMVIAAKNPVHSVLFLILAFVNAAGLFVLMGAEFLAMILIVVYVGAVLVLFLFVVMMLDVDFTELREGYLNYLPVGVVIGIIFLFELLLVVGSWVVGTDVPRTITAPIPPVAAVSNTEALGRVLYTRYVYYFQTAGLILLVAMVYTMEAWLPARQPRLLNGPRPLSRCSLQLKGDTKDNKHVYLIGYDNKKNQWQYKVSTIAIPGRNPLVNDAAIAIQKAAHDGERAAAVEEVLGATRQGQPH